MARRWLARTVVIGVSALALVMVPETARSLQLQFQSKPHEADNGKHHRIKTDLARMIATWRGTNDCRSAARAKAALKPAAAAWLGRQVMARPKEKLVRWGYHSGDIWTETQIIGGKTQCIAGFRKLIVYADFR